MAPGAGRGARTGALMTRGGSAVRRAITLVAAVMLEEAGGAAPERLVRERSAGGSGYGEA